MSGGEVHLLRTLDAGHDEAHLPGGPGLRDQQPDTVH